METVFLACFVFGALFTVASLVLGFAGHGAMHFGHDHSLPHLGHGHADLHVGHAESGDHFPLLSASSLVGALTWFGAAGFVLDKLGDLALPAVILGALAAGAIGWYLVARFLGLVLKGERVMDPDDYRLEGTLGQITVSIPPAGTGEIVFSMAGARRSEAARALGGAAIPRGTEVVITSYADGFATVQPWGEFVAARSSVAALENKEA
jgi:membrane protein implicated in regulation of membrane protease activity